MDEGLNGRNDTSAHPMTEGPNGATRAGSSPPFALASTVLPRFTQRKKSSHWFAPELTAHGAGGIAFAAFSPVTSIHSQPEGRRDIWKWKRCVTSTSNN